MSKREFIKSLLYGSTVFGLGWGLAYAASGGYVTSPIRHRVYVQLRQNPSAQEAWTGDGTIETPYGCLELAEIACGNHDDYMILVRSD